MNYETTPRAVYIAFSCIGIGDHGDLVESETAIQRVDRPTGWLGIEIAFVLLLILTPGLFLNFMNGAK